MNQKTRGHVFIVSAPAGTGKTTLVERLVAENDHIVRSVSFTSRPPRGNEVEGVDYHFVSRERFAKMITEGAFLEYVELYGDFYGTSSKWVEEKIAAGTHVILVIDTQGAHYLKQKIEATHIFIMPPSMAALEERLINRSTESAEAMERRLDWAKHEIEAGEDYDNIIVNDDLEIAYQDLVSIVKQKSTTEKI